MSELVTVARFYEVPAALCAQSALDSAGIPSHLSGLQMAQTDWHWLITIDGIVLMVLASDEDEAREILGGIAPEPDTFETGPDAFKRRPLFNGILSALLLVPFGFFVPFWLRRRQQQNLRQTRK